MSVDTGGEVRRLDLPVLDGLPGGQFTMAVDDGHVHIGMKQFLIAVALTDFTPAWYVPAGCVDGSGGLAGVCGCDFGPA